MRKKVRKAKKIFAGLLSAMLALSAVNVSGWGVMNVKDSKYFNRKRNCAYIRNKW